MVFNQWQLASLHQMLPDSHDSLLTTAGSGQVSKVPLQSQNDLASLAKQILPRGMPPLYGAELGISFDQAAAAIPVLARYEQDSRPDKLSGEKLARYIAIGQRTSCEFCCSATTMVFPDGRKACACAHSAAMRGVVAYLLDRYGQQLTDQQILTEANKWKAVFFPGPTTQKFAAQNGLINTSAQGLKQQVGGC